MHPKQKDNWTKWDSRFEDLAKLVSTWSKDPSTKTGCVITRGNRIISLGFNGYPSGVIDSRDDSREAKLDKTVHAEVNAILHAKQSLAGCSLYTFPLPVCSRCASIIIQVEISRVISLIPLGLDVARWVQAGLEGEKMFAEAGIKQINRII